ncbi:MAG: orotate phosphoribosyltransferase [Polyangiaceae bacterium]|nr:orotate phosphoribosyltransferase [Polyangiaceae bacterium]
MIDANQRNRLIALLTEQSFERKRVILASGRESDFFIDCKQVALTAEGHALLGELMLDALDDLPKPTEAVAGVELGGCPLASAVSLTSYLHHRPMPALYVRKTQKDHGMKKLIEGDKAMRPGMPVVLLEDVITTGGSTLRAADTLREAGLDPVGVVVIVDRLEGGGEALREAGLPYVALATRKDFIPD